ncbi:uncharacterized protein TNCV_2321051 [Trichonephila clavipes]|nr:uncharacterized protein TNCV_2321051 [Trichonephila clavipes]
MYSWYTLDNVHLENPSGLTISEIEWPMSQAPTICTRSRTSKSGTLNILAIPTTNSEQLPYALYMKLPQRPYLCINDAQRYPFCIALAIPNSVAF